MAEVPVLWKQSSMPFVCGLVVRVGQADETPMTGGITHLIEHLSLPTRWPPEVDFNASVDPLFTQFWFAGPQRLALAMLTQLTRDLAHLPFERLPRERSILKAESSWRGSPGVYQGALLLRFGAAGHGQTALHEYGLEWVGRAEVRDWAALAFVAANARAYMTARPPAGFVLELPRGRRLPLPSVDPAPVTLPAVWTHGPYGGAAISMLVERSYASVIAEQLAVRRLNGLLRYRLGITYSATSRREPVSRRLLPRLPLRRRPQPRRGCRRARDRRGARRACGTRPDGARARPRAGHDAAPPDAPLLPPEPPARKRASGARRIRGGVPARAARGRHERHRRGRAPGGAAGARFGASAAARQRAPARRALRPLPGRLAETGERSLLPAGRTGGSRRRAFTRRGAEGGDAGPRRRPPLDRPLRGLRRVYPLEQRSPPMGTRRRRRVGRAGRLGERRGGGREHRDREGARRAADRRAPGACPLRRPRSRGGVRALRRRTLVRGGGRVRARARANAGGRRRVGLPGERARPRGRDTASAGRGRARVATRHGGRLGAAVRLPRAHAARTSLRGRPPRARGAAAEPDVAREPRLAQASTALAEDGLLDEAARLSARALELFPGRPAAWVCDAWASRARGDLDHAIEQARRATSQDPDEWLWHATVARLLLEHGEPAAALDELAAIAEPSQRDAEAAAPDRARALAFLGRDNDAAAVRAEHHARLVGRAREHLAARPGDPDALVELAEALACAPDGDPAEAAALLQRALAATGPQAWPLVVRARAELALGDDRAARRSLLAATRCEPEHTAVLLDRARLAALNARTADGALASAALTRLRPGSAAATFAEACALVAAGNWRPALKATRAATARAPLSCCAQALAGLALAGLGRDEDARSTLGAARARATGRCGTADRLEALLAKS